MNALLLIVILSVVEGLTEFLPISSTGHMILIEQFLGEDILPKNFVNNFFIIVQLGAILAVVLYFWENISPFTKTKQEFIFKFRLWLKILVGFLPAAVIGFFLDDIIDKYFLDNIFIIAGTLIFYGIIFIIIEIKNKNNKLKKINKFERLKYRTAFYIGFFQCLAMIPGTSRSGATIIGALLLGLSRPLATEFSFYLAIPTMFGASFLKIVKNGVNFTNQEILYLVLGLLLSFIVAYGVIKWFMSFIKKKDFVFFGIYRIILGLSILLYIFLCNR